MHMPSPALPYHRTIDYNLMEFCIDGLESGLRRAVMNIHVLDHFTIQVYFLTGMVLWSGRIPK